MFVDFNKGYQRASFKPYRREDVKVGKGGYVQVTAAGFAGKVWATCWVFSRDARAEIGEKYRVEILGHGSQPGNTIFLGDYSAEDQALLLATV